MDDEIGKTQKAPGAERKPGEQDFQAIANILNNSKIVFLEFEEHKYQSDIVEIRLGEFIMLKVAKPDQGLVNVPVRYEFCKLRVLGMQGEAHIFPVKLLQKKFPLVVMSFPEGEEAGFARSAVRLFLRQATPVLVRRKDNVLVPRDLTGAGVITDLSEGGCSLVSKMQFSKGDKIRIFLNVSLEKEPRNIEIFCTVRRAQISEDGQGDYGLEFHAPEKTRADITYFLSHHPAARKGT